MVNGYFKSCQANHARRAVSCIGQCTSEVALGDIKDIVSSSIDSETIFESLCKYMSSNAGVTLYAWGEFEDLLSSDDPFCAEVRSDFRDTQLDQDYDEKEQEADAARAISPGEMDEFCESLAETPT